MQINDELRQQINKMITSQKEFDEADERVIELVGDMDQYSDVDLKDLFSKLPPSRTHLLIFDRLYSRRK